MGKKTFIAFFLNVLKNIQLKPKKTQKNPKNPTPKMGFQTNFGFFVFFGVEPPPSFDREFTKTAQAVYHNIFPFSAILRPALLVEQYLLFIYAIASSRMYCHFDN